MPGDIHVEDSPELADAEVMDVAMLVERAAEVDGVRPLSEQVMAQLLAGSGHTQRHVGLWRGESLLGYAHVDLADRLRPSVEIAISPEGRGDGAGELLLDHLLATTEGAMQLWCHGPDAGIGSIAASRGLIRRRELIRMRRTLVGDVPHVETPARFTIRPFEVGHDEAAFLDLNTRAFADLPDQGSWTESDLTARLTAPWFDANGFLLAFEQEADGAEGRLVGFHWTKVHGDSGDLDATDNGLGPVGEVYVLATDPDLRGSGLGRALTTAGLAHLRARGLDSVMLYVEADNEAAIRTYRSLGFRPYESDALYTPGGPGAARS